MTAFLWIFGLVVVGLTTRWLLEHSAKRGVAGWRLIIPFMASAYIREYWEDVRWVALARIAGATFVLMGVGVALAKHPVLLSQPWLLWQVNEQSASGNTQVDVERYLMAQKQVIQATKLKRDRTLSGQINGRPFYYTRASLVNNMLDVRQGSEFFPELEVRVMLDIDPRGIESRQEFYIKPSDKNPPEVFVTWRNDDGGIQTRIVKREYSLQLALAPRAKGRLSATMQLILPGEPLSYLSGDFVLETNHLRYKGDDVDITFDHTDTLEYVALQYLNGLYSRKAVQQVEIQSSQMNLHQKSGTAIATVLLSDNQLEEHRLELERMDFGWQVKPGSNKVTVLRQGGEALKASAAPEPIYITLEDLPLYYGERVVLTRVDGGKEEAIMRGLGRRGLLVEEKISAGSVEFHIDPDSITQITLRNGQPLLWKKDQEQETGLALQENDQPAAAKPKVAEKPEEPELDELSDFAQFADLKGHQVKVVAKDGKERVGRLDGLATNQLTLTVSMGAGAVQFFYKPEDVESVEPLKK